MSGIGVGAYIRPGAYTVPARACCLRFRLIFLSCSFRRSSSSLRCRAEKPAQQQCRWAVTHTAQGTAWTQHAREAWAFRTWHSTACNAKQQDLRVLWMNHGQYAWHVTHVTLDTTVTQIQRQTQRPVSSRTSHTHIHTHTHTHARTHARTHREQRTGRSKMHLPPKLQ